MTTTFFLVLFFLIKKKVLNIYVLLSKVYVNISKFDNDK